MSWGIDGAFKALEDNSMRETAIEGQRKIDVSGDLDFWLIGRLGNYPAMVKKSLNFASAFVEVPLGIFGFHFEPDTKLKIPADIRGTELAEDYQKWTNSVITVKKSKIESWNDLLHFRFEESLHNDEMAKHSQAKADQVHLPAHNYAGNDEIPFLASTVGIAANIALITGAATGAMVISQALPTTIATENKLG